MLIQIQTWGYGSIFGNFVLIFMQQILSIQSQFLQFKSVQICQIQNSPEFSLGETPNSNSYISPPIQNSNLPISPLIQISNPTPTIKELQSGGGQLQPIEITYSRKKHLKNMEIPDASHSQESNPESSMETKQSDHSNCSEKRSQVLYTASHIQLCYLRTFARLCSSSSFQLGCRENSK